MRVFSSKYPQTNQNIPGLGQKNLIDRERFMKRIPFPIELPFRTFVAITFAGTIAFHLVGLAIHTTISRQKTHLVAQIETLAEIRSQVSGLDSSLSLLRERVGRTMDHLSAPEQSPMNQRNLQKISGEFHLIFMLLKSFEANGDRAQNHLVQKWVKEMDDLNTCKVNKGPDLHNCLLGVQDRLSTFLSQIQKARGTISSELLRVEAHQSRLEYWDTILYWLTTVSGLLFMGLGWRNVLRQVGSPMHDVTDYLESYQEHSPSAPPILPSLFQIREIRILKESMTNIHNDFLTGILARHAIMGVLKREVELSGRSGAPLSVAIFDVDFFKKVNDQYGHPAGDRALQHVVLKIQQSIRKTDWFGRWGGEEFLLICPNLPKKDAWSRLDEIREAIREPLVLSPVATIILSASVGVSFFPESPDLETIMTSADKALYIAKESGRNRVVLS